MTQAGRVLGVDYGTRRVGLAISDPLNTLAVPHGTAEVVSDKAAAAAVAAAVEETGVTRVVVGLPLNMDGSRGEMAERVEAFVRRLQGRLRVPVETCDERLSSQQVERAMLEADVSRGKRKQAVDKLAAQAILQGWLDARAGG